MQIDTITIKASNNENKDYKCSILIGYLPSKSIKYTINYRKIKIKNYPIADKR